MKNKRANFYSIIDFFKNRERIKKEYKNMSIDEKEIYKLYVYSICFENDFTKDCIWEYLNCIDGEEITYLVPLSKEYSRRIKCRK